MMSVPARVIVVPAACLKTRVGVNCASRPTLIPAASAMVMIAL
jgi:hypothetical protein